MHVDLVMRQIEIAHRRHRHDGEGLIDLEKIDVRQRPAGALEQGFKAPIGAVGNRPGACAWVAWPMMRASGSSRALRLRSSRISTSAAAPSEME